MANGSIREKQKVMADKFYYICDAKRKLKDEACTGKTCKYLKNGDCERTADHKYAKNKFDRKNFQFVAYQAQGDLDIYSEKDKKGNYI